MKTLKFTAANGGLTFYHEPHNDWRDGDVRTVDDVTAEALCRLHPLNFAEVKPVETKAVEAPANKAVKGKGK